jgi:hypothetical protein
MMRGMPFRVGAVLLAAATLVVLAACSPSQKPTSPRSPGGSPVSSPMSPAPSGTAPSDSSSNAEKQMRPNELAADQMQAIRSYLSVRENAESVQYASHPAWRRAMAKVTTVSGAKQSVERYEPAETSNAQNVAQQGNYVVKILLGGCTTNPAFHNTSSTIAAQCDLTDLVVTKAGAVVPTEQIDPSWPYSGTQTSPLLVLQKTRGQWLVDADYTGQAS